MKKRFFYDKLQLMGKIFALDIGQEFWIKQEKGIKNLSHFNSLGDFFSSLLPNFYALAGLILLFFLIFGGLMVILGAGKGSEEQIEKGKKVLTNTLIGFLVILFSYWIIQILEIITGIPML